MNEKEKNKTIEERSASLFTNQNNADTINFNSDEEITAGLEAILMVVETPVDALTLATALGCSEAKVTQLLGELAAQYLGNRQMPQRGFVLRQVGGGWRIYSNPKYEELVRSFIIGSTSGRISQAALETLAIIAYKQPCTRAQVAAIRGVNSDSVIRNLVARYLIEEVGIGSSGASLYGTTKLLLEQLDLQSLEQLPPLAPYLPSNVDFEQIALQYGEKLVGMRAKDETNAG